MLTEQNTYVVRPYTPDDNAGLAVMWNESDDQWPGTFTGGVPLTEKRVREWMEHETCLMQLVAEQTDGTSGIVGYGSLWETPGRTNSCYVALLNVSPGHQKRSLARRMLIQMIEWATENGYHRVTIETWPANLKSVPLYKKVGFSWVPDYDVFMENYIPAVRQLAVAKPFFERHDWYTTFQRRLDQKEDEERHPAMGDMEVFVLRWEKDGEFIEAVVDRYSQAITGIATAGFSAYAIVDESEPAQGMRYPVRWRVTNKQEQPVHVSILADGEKGIQIEYRKSFTVQAGETCVNEAAFVCAVEAERLKLDSDEREKAAPAIKTVLVIGGEVLEFATGLHYRQAIDISMEPKYPSLLPDQRQNVRLVLRNRAGRALKGAVSLVPQEGLDTNWMRHDFDIEAGQHAGLPLDITCRQPGAIPVVATAEFSGASQQIQTMPERIPLLAVPLGGVCADQNENEIVVENDFLRIVCQADGGHCKISNKAFSWGDMELSGEIGPPFNPGDLGRRVHTLALSNGRGWANVTMTVKSERFPGLCVIREILTTASPVIQVNNRIVNTSVAAVTFQFRPTIRLSRYEASMGRLVLPRVERLVAEPAPAFGETDGDIPKEPEKMAEQWLALDCQGQTGAVIWNRDIVKLEYWWRHVVLYSPEHTIEPQAYTDIAPFYLYAGPGNWQNVRRIWQRTVGASQPKPENMPEPERAYTFRLSPTPLVTMRDAVKAQCLVDNIRDRALQGRVSVQPPAGWMLDRTEMQLKDIRNGKPFSEEIQLSASDGRVGAFSGQLRLETELFDEDDSFAVIRLGDEHASVGVEQREQSEQTVWELNNGRSVWTVAPDFHGGVIAWHEKKAEDSPSHLMTAFPEDGDLGWMKPWFGGIRPTLTIPGKNYDWPGKLHAETFAVEPVTIERTGALTWQGVRLKSALKREGLEGLRVELEYLTVGGSNVLNTIFRIVNESSAPRRVAAGWFVCPQVDGEHRNSAVYADDWQRKRTPHEAWARVGSWGAVVNPDTGRAMVMVSASGDKLLGLSDWGKDGGHFWCDEVLTVPAHERYEQVAYLALAGSLEEARCYDTLKYWGRE